MVDARLLASAVGDHRLLQVSAGGTGSKLAGPKFAPKLRTNNIIEFEYLKFIIYNVL